MLCEALQASAVAVSESYHPCHVASGSGGSAKGIPDFVSDRRYGGLLNGLFDGAAIKPFFDG